MRHLSWQTVLGLCLIALSVVLYALHFVIFQDAHHIFIYLLGDIAFLPIEVLLVTLIIHRLLGEREKRSMLNKLNMVIGAFFSEVGTELMGRVSQSDCEGDRTRAILMVAADWSHNDFLQAGQRLKGHALNIECTEEDLEYLRGFLIGKRDFLLRMLENPNLLEHETFTELLWAVFHLSEELARRSSIEGLPKADRDHLSGDVKRAYALLLYEWLQYMKHLKTSYPYLFSLAVRTNPFDPNASPVFGADAATSEDKTDVSLPVGRAYQG